MKKLNIAVFGASGRMGQELGNLMKDSLHFSPALGICSSGQADHFIKVTSDLDPNELADIDVMIDFSNAEAFQEALSLAVKGKTPFVSGTTGISNQDFKRIQVAQAKIPILWAPNMSLGIAALVQALESLKAISHFDFQIEETHHRHKKDRPSGTALQLQQKLENVLDRKLPEPLALRGGGVFGVHQVHALGENETLVFEHRALNRQLFAEGALFAARWLARKKKGLFSMQDVLSL